MVNKNLDPKQKVIQERGSAFAEYGKEEKKHDLRIWWVPNPPRPAFHYIVKSVEEALKVLDVLADYDNYLGDDIIFANASGLQIKDNGMWVEWHNTDDEDVDELRHKEAGEELNLKTHEDY